MLREFEDQENLLAEMDEQVDAYRAAGKQEAALRYGQSLWLMIFLNQTFKKRPLVSQLFHKITFKIFKIC